LRERKPDLNPTASKPLSRVPPKVISFGAREKGWGKGHRPRTPNRTTKRTPPLSPASAVTPLPMPPPRRDFFARRAGPADIDSSPAIDVNPSNNRPNPLCHHP